MKCWHVPYSDETFLGLEALVQQNQITIPELKELKEERKYRFFDKKPPEDSNKLIENFAEYMRIQRYSKKTQQTYIEAMKTFLGYFRQKSALEITENDIIEFNLNYILRNNFSASYQNQIISAIKLFYHSVLLKDISLTVIERPIRSRPLPEVFAPEEVEVFLRTIRNIKHKAVMALIYACGLRRGEVLNLRISAVDSKRRMLCIKEAKGNKDRLVPLPEGIIILLREYYKECRPLIWLFEGNVRGKQYSESSLRETFVKAKKKAGIRKKLTLHSLRHSYATHLLENGVDLRFIQELMGHRSSKTTEIYTHVTTKSLEKIKSPFENLKI